MLENESFFFKLDVTVSTIDNYISVVTNAPFVDQPFTSGRSKDVDDFTSLSTYAFTPQIQSKTLCQRYLNLLQTNVFCCIICTSSSFRTRNMFFPAWQLFRHVGAIRDLKLSRTASVPSRLMVDVCT